MMLIVIYSFANGLTETRLERQRAEEESGIENAWNADLQTSKPFLRAFAKADSETVSS